MHFFLQSLILVAALAVFRRTPALEYAPVFLLALAIEKNGSADRDGLSAALREIASAPGEVIKPGEWEKAKQLIADGVDINYEGASGPHDFDEFGDVSGVIVEYAVQNGAWVEVGPIE